MLEACSVGIQETEGRRWGIDGKRTNASAFQKGRKRMLHEVQMLECDIAKQACGLAKIHEAICLYSYSAITVFL